MEFSEAELFLAYRQAKIALHQERFGLGRIAVARSEVRLPEIIRRLRRQLRHKPGWFSGLPLGRVWLVPKKADMAKRKGIITIGADFICRTERLSIRPHVTPSIEFAVVEILWLWTFGAALETVLRRNPHGRRSARGNRLKRVSGGSGVDRLSQSPFEYWPPAYEAFRQDGFAVARSILSRPGGECVVATFDLANYYDEIDARFLLEPSFVQTIRIDCNAQGIDFDEKEYLRSTRSLIAAFRRYHQACRRATGLVMNRGIPIGCLTSKVISNLALASTDDYVSTQSGVKYYARYVDDILLVAEPKARRTRTPEGVASTFLPIDRRFRGRREKRLDSVRLGRKGSSFRLQHTKLKAYHLVGKPGREFLDTVERDVRLIASERRAFLYPDGLGSESPISAFSLSSDENVPVQVLRDVDRWKVGRYRASVIIGKVSVGVELLGQPESERWCRSQLQSLAEAVTDPTNWLEFVELSIRALGVCIRASDVRTTRLILGRQLWRWHQLRRSFSSTTLSWNNKRLARQQVWESLSNWFSSKVLEEIVSSIPHSVIASTEDLNRFLSQIGKRPLIVDRHRIGASDIRRLAKLLAQSDLRTVDRESDYRDAPASVQSIPRRTSVGWRRLSSSLRANSETDERIAKIDRFLEACEGLRDAAYTGLSAIDMLLLTRPPSAFDIAHRWGYAGLPLDDLTAVTNALRGTRYSASPARQPDPHTIDMLGPFDNVFAKAPDGPLLILANMRTEETWMWSAAAGSPVLSRERVSRLGRILNQAIRRRRTSQLDTLVLMPELGLPLRWLRPLAHRMIAEDVNIILGLEYRLTPNGLINEAVGIFTPGFHSVVFCRWPKSLPSRVEARLCAEKGFTFVENSPASGLVVNTAFGAISTLICSELLDVEVRSTLRGRIDLLVVPSWNKDTATFDHTIQTVANDLHAYVAVANNGHHSDCRVQVPSDKRYRRDALRLICREEDCIVTTKVDIASLRSFQLRSLSDVKADIDGFKPLPPGYKFRR